LHFFTGNPHFCASEKDVTEEIIHKSAFIADELKRLAKEICDADPESPVLVGIRTNGVPLAARLAVDIEQCSGSKPGVGAIDITLYRDDLGGRALPKVLGSEIPPDLEGRRVVLVDDVLFTGRTVRAALTELADYGRPRRVELCVLVDRGHRELPICADFTGFVIETERDDRIRVTLRETSEGDDAVLLIQGDN
jgi:pyrimidine operon attenuation protein/uracil phosphoribosyltransferase